MDLLFWVQNGRKGKGEEVEGKTDGNQGIKEKK